MLNFDTKINLDEFYFLINAVFWCLDLDIKINLDEFYF